MNFNHPTLIKRIKWRLRDAWEIFRYDIPYFFKNIWRFRKEMWGFRPWDYNFNIKMWRASLFELCEYIDKKGLEIDETRLKKVKWMRRAIYLMDLIIGGDFSEIAEKRLGFEYKFSPIEFEPYFNEAGGKYFIMKENEDKETYEKNRKLFQEESMIEREVWLELFEILQGNNFRANLYTDPSLKDKSYEEFMDGKGIVNWWD